MQSRLRPFTVLQQARILLESIDGEEKVIAIARTAALDIGTLTLALKIDELSTSDLPISIENLKMTAERLRKNLNRLLGQYVYPSSQYNLIHNALLLLAYYFPYGVEEKTSAIKCCITLEEIPAEDSRFVIASGHHFSERGSLAFCNYGDYSRNPHNRQPITSRDQDRLKLLYWQQPSDQRPPLETHSLEYAGVGMLMGAFYVVVPIMGGGSILFTAMAGMVALGVISFPAFIITAMASPLLPTVLVSIEFFPIVLGAVIGAIAGLFPASPDVSTLKEKVGDVFENAPLKTLKNQRRQDEEKPPLAVSSSAASLFGRRKSCPQIHLINHPPKRRLSF